MKNCWSLLSRMPFLDRLEAAAISGWSSGALYESVARMEDAGLISSVPHATVLTAATRRSCLTAFGLRCLAEREGVAVDELLRTRPVSDWWRRLLLERLDGVAVIYRLVATVAGISYPVNFRWYRAMPMDAGLILPGGRTIAVVRQGHTSDRTGFSKRLWRLREVARPDGILLLAPDATRLRHSRRVLAGNPAPSFLAVEAEAALAGVDDPVWTLSSVNASLSLRDALDRMGSGGTLPVERDLSRIRLPEELKPEAQGPAYPGLLASRVAQAHRETSHGRRIRLALDLAGRPGGAAGTVPHPHQSPHPGPGALRPCDKDTRGRPAPHHHGPGDCSPGSPGPDVGRVGEDAMEFSPSGCRRLAQRVRQAEPPVASEYGAHGGRARLHGGPGPAGNGSWLGNPAARPAPQGVPLL